MLHGKPGACAPGAGLHLVADQQDAVGVAQCAQALQQLGRRDYEAAFTLNRLNDDGGNALGLDVVFENRLDRRNGVVHCHAVQRIREGGVEYLCGERAKAG